MINSAHKRRRWRLLILIPVMLAPFAIGEAFGIARQSLLFEAPSRPSALIDEVSHAVFEIDCEPGEYLGSGWGLKMGDDYFVVTAEHVVTECAESGFIRASNASVGAFYLEMVSIDGRYWLSTAVGDRDLALLAASKKIPALKFQSTEPQIGQWVAAFGFPISFETGGLSVTQGHLSGVESSGHLLTDAAINSGNSGGPAVNSRGEVVGTVFASDPNDKSDNIGYLQGKGQHCGLVFQCDGDTIFYVPPLEQIKFVSE